MLLRLALEHANNTTRLFNGDTLPELLEMLDVNFLRPVPIQAALSVRGAVLETTSARQPVLTPTEKRNPLLTMSINSIRQNTR